MADEFSFDVVSKVDLQFVDNGINSVNREIAVRFDFRGSVSKVEFDKVKAEITIHSDDDGKLKSVTDIVNLRLVKAGIDLKSLEFGSIDRALGATVRQVVKISQGIKSEKAKAIVADLKSAKVKVNASIKGEELRVTAKSKDALQEAISFIKSKDYGIPLQFTNYR